MTEAEAPATSKQGELPKELTEFLVEFSIGVHRFAMYPPEHPSLEAAVETIVARLDELFAERASLSIGVAQKQLVIEGIATDQRHALLMDLARRMHDHQLGALTLKRGIDAPQVRGVLTAMASETERGGTPLGMLSTEERPRWECASLHRVGYDRLELVDHDGEGERDFNRADALWLGLAQAALASEEKLEVAPDAESVAKVIRSHEPEEAYDQVIVGYMLQLADELKEESGQESERVRNRVSRLINELDHGTLSRLVRFGENPAQRRRFVLDASQGLAVDSVVKVLEAAAKSEEQGISNSMTRLLSKLAVHAEHGTPKLKSQASEALRENVESLIAGWELKDPNPEAYTNVLESISRAAPVLANPEEEEGEEGSLAGARRLVEMALEVDAHGPIVERALSDLLDGGSASTLLEYLKQVPPSNELAGRIHGQLTSPDRFRDLLTGGRMDDATLRALIGEMGSSAVDPLLEVLGETDSDDIRDRVTAALVAMGPSVGERVVEHLEEHLAEDRFPVVCTLLSLLNRMEERPRDFDPSSYFHHEEPEVRREALPLVLRRSEGRERVLVAALADPDEEVARTALLEIQEEVPDSVVATLVNRVVWAKERPDELRSLGVTALTGSRSSLALSTLVALCTRGRTIFGRPRLARPTGDVLVALHALATAWADRKEAKEILARARRSKDPDIQRAVRLTASADDPGTGSAP